MPSVCGGHAVDRSPPVQGLGVKEGPEAAAPLFSTCPLCLFYPAFLLTSFIQLSRLGGGLKMSRGSGTGGRALDSGGEEGREAGMLERWVRVANWPGPTLLFGGHHLGKSRCG